MMASYTPNYDLYLPSRNDSNIAVDESLADNFTKIDVALTNNSSQLGILIKVKANPLFYGAKGDGVTNDLTAIINAINSMPNGGILEIPANDFLIYGSGTELLLITKPIQIQGKGEYSRLLIDATVGVNTDIIRLSPDTSLKKDFGSIEGIHIAPVSGTPGRHAINLDVTNAGQYISRFLLYRNHIETLGGYGVNLTNPTNADGLFASTFTENLLYGGMNFQRIGDSNLILHNTITGKNTGITMSTVQGACQNVIQNNNITSDGGAMYISNSDQVKIIQNQIEQVNPYTGTSDACIYVNNAPNAEIEGNNITCHGNVPHNIHVGASAYRVKISKNTMRQGTAEIIYVEAGANKTDIGYDNFYINTSEQEIAPSILDNGTGTIGIRKTITPSNNWAVVGGTFAPFGVKKFSNGNFQFTGQLQNGTTTAGTVIGTLPVGFRPDSDRRIHVGTWKTGSPAVAGTGVLVIGSGGNITIETLDSAVTRLDFDGITLPANY